MHKYFFLGVMMLSVMSIVAMEKANQLYGDEITLYSKGPVTKSIMNDSCSGVYILDNKNWVTDSIKELDIKSGKELHVFENHERLLSQRYGMTIPVINDFIYDQGKIIVGTEQGAIRIWDSQNKNLIAELINQDKSVKALAMLKTTNKLCSVLNKGAKIWDIKENRWEQDICSEYYNGSLRGCIQKKGALYIADEYRLNLINEKSGKYEKLLSGTYITAIADDKNSEHCIFVSIWDKILAFDIRKFREPIFTISQSNKEPRQITALCVFNDKLYVGRCSGSSAVKKNPYPRIKAFDIRNNFKPVVDLPGKAIIYHLEINDLGVFVSSEKGLTFFPALSK